jgi:hypothetical protein
MASPLHHHPRVFDERGGLTIVPDWYTTFCCRMPAFAMGAPP